VLKLQVFTVNYPQISDFFCGLSAAEAFGVTDELNWEEVHRGLQEFLELLKDVINSHPHFNSTDLLHLTASIIANVKGLSLLFWKVLTSFTLCFVVIHMSAHFFCISHICSEIK